MTDIRQSINYKNYLESQGWIVKRVDNINYFLRKIPILGSVLKVQRPVKLNFKTIQKLEKKYRVFQTIIEPNDKKIEARIQNLGYKLSKSPFLPTKTLHLDLTKNERQIWEGFSKHTRQAIRKSVIAFGSDEMKGSGGFIKKSSSPKKIEKFRNAWKKSVNFNRYVPSLESLLNLKKSFPNNHLIFLASHNKFGSIIGGAIFTISSHGVSDYITYYWHGFTNYEGRTSLSQYALLYQGILWAKKNGSRIFDFEGIYDERFPNKSWLGFTHFKKSFGGTEILYPGCYTKLRLPNPFQGLIDAFSVFN
ncbi:MAG: hypothetical protein AAB778_01880 [Patescibacteria group bacterium]